KQDRLSQMQVEKLNNIGFTWNYFNAAWEKAFNDLCKFKNINGHLNIPKNNALNHSLELWCSKQRTLYKNKKLSQDKIKKFESIGFDWDPLKSAWEEQFSELQKYKNKFGTCNVPINYVDNPSLANWVNRQRTSFVKGKLPQELIKKLSDIGLVFEPDKKAWETMYFELCRFKESNGNCLVSANYSKNPALSRWVSKQRTKYKQNNLSREYTKQLNDIGFIWNLKSEQPKYDIHFDKGDKCFLFSHFPRDYSIHKNLPFNIFDGVSIVETPSYALSHAEGIDAKPTENIALASYVYPEYVQTGCGVVHVCIKIDKNIPKDQMDRLFWTTVSALIIVKPIFLRLSGAFIYGDREQFICNPEKLVYKSNLSLDAIKHQHNFNDNLLSYNVHDLKLVKSIFPKIFNILNSRDSLQRPCCNLDMFFQSTLWENLNYQHSIFSKLFPLLDSFAGNPSGNHAENVSSKIAHFLANITCQSNSKKFSEEEIKNRLKYIWELNRYPELHGHLKLPSEQTNFTKDLFNLFEISRLCIYKMLLLSEHDFESYSKIPTPSLGISMSEAKELNRQRDNEAKSFFDKTYDNPTELINFLDFTSEEKWGK
ncbi:MAG: helicase associated domain-containing protein, partial [Candidatus Babeliales bacterium]